MKLFLLLTILIFTVQVNANDGVFFMRGNHLIPAKETDISIQKEVLNIQRIENNYLQIKVHYEFNNPGPEKTLIVGFEAPFPSGDVDETINFNEHPFIKNFSVVFNSDSLKFNIVMIIDSIVNYDSIILGNIKSKFESNENEYEFHRGYYVYYFDAVFKTGINILEHTYEFFLSASVETYYEFNYILTTVNRWANESIDDFTLTIDMGDFQEFSIVNTFFENFPEWHYTGKAVLDNSSNHIYHDVPVTTFYTRTEPIVFEKKDFRPAGDLSLFSKSKSEIIEQEKFDYKLHSLPYNIESAANLTNATDQMSFEILCKLPYARRGQIFESSEIQKYFEKMKWYELEKNYKAFIKHLTQDELDWLKKVEANKLLIPVIQY